jgi:hypothetical protein
LHPMTHVCEQLRKLSGHDVRIEKLGRNWYIWISDEATLSILYCPCCGVKL